MIKNDPRLEVYMYYNQLVSHLDNKLNLYLTENAQITYPRQFEIHLPGNHIDPCKLNCPHCAGKFFKKDLGTWEMEGLELLDKLKGAIPYHIYGGAYTEPLMNPYYMSFLHMTKKYGNHFGIHTNGVLLNWLEKEMGWLTELNRIATDDIDYLSVSIDAGTPISWGKTKGTKDFDQFWQIVYGLEHTCRIKKENGKTHAVRICYLISPISGNIEDFKDIIDIAKYVEADSLRFSIPFGCYNQDFDKIKQYKHNRELPGDLEYRRLLAPYLSKSKDEKPYIFYTGPEFTDIDRFNFQKCFYHLYQITYGADGYAYKCSTTATPTAKHCRIGKITANLKEFERLIEANSSWNWDCQKMCFNKNLRCNRMGLEINTLCNEHIKNEP